MRKYLIALSAVAIVAGAPVAAEDFTVKHDDLDLSTPKGQKALDRRIDSAARKYCAVGTVRTGSHFKDGNASKCYAEARNAAREQMAGLIARTKVGG